MNAEFRSTFNRLMASLLSLSAAVFAGLPQSLAAQDTIRVPYESLGLSPQQAQSIERLEADWQRQFAQLYPQLRQHQKDLVRLLADPRSDPLEVTAVQHKIASLKARLQLAATTNYLNKRKVLNDSQKTVLEGMLKRMLAERMRGVM
ncbi:MAG TPA: hypothetical protein V6D08_10105 [Candidatus Obscuribacterales bacterium]